jgi:GNAT superfamily N-acetyltransferase
MRRVSSSAISVWKVETPITTATRVRLGEILIDCVADGASVGFLAPLSAADADEYWRNIELAAEGGRCLLFGAGTSGELPDGIVLLDIDTMPNQPHLARVSKLLVHPAARRRGIGEALMAALEEAAPGAGRWLLTLDTATASAERLYLRRGWTHAGVFPDYALNPDGSLTDTQLYWRRLARDREPAPSESQSP